MSGIRKVTELSLLHASILQVMDFNSEATLFQKMSLAVSASPQVITSFAKKLRTCVHNSSRILRRRLRLSCGRQILAGCYCHKNIEFTALPECKSSTGCLHSQMEYLAVRDELPALVCIVPFMAHVTVQCPF